MGDGVGWGDHPPVNEDSNGNPPFPIGNTFTKVEFPASYVPEFFRFLLGGAKKGGRWSVDFVGKICCKKWPSRG